nr:hypothetical protein [Halalkalibacter alkalisediminis]
MTTFKLDKAHSGVAFQVKQTKGKGEFKNFDAGIQGDIANP